MNDLSLEEQQKLAKVKAIDYLARREHSRAELEQKLTQKKFDAQVVSSLLDELEVLDYLSDERYSAMLVRSGFDRGHGPIRIKQKMKQKGISSALSAQSFDEFEGDWFSLAGDVWRRKFKDGLDENLAKQDRAAFYKEKSRQMRFLASRGFSMDQIEYALASAQDD